MRKERIDRYQSWSANEAGIVALERSQALLRTMYSGWPRRSRSMLVMGVGTGQILESLWEAGFDVTGQESDPALLQQAQSRLGSRAQFVLSAPDHLPFDECAFDYTVVVAAYEFWESPQSVLHEIERLTCSGIILIFPNAWSLFGLECRFRRGHDLCAFARPLLQSPYQVWRMARKTLGKQKTAWASVLPAFTWTWKEGRIFRMMNSPQCPLPVGAFAGLRVDFGPVYSATPLLLKATDGVAPAE